MAVPTAAALTQLLKTWSDGDTDALERLTPLVMDELKRIARRRLHAEHGGHTMQATPLVNEAYLRLLDVTSIRWEDRAHFFAICARIMRRILVEAARTRMAEKRGGAMLRVTFEDDLPAAGRESEFVALDDALDELSKLD